MRSRRASATPHAPLIVSATLDVVVKPSHLLLIGPPTLRNHMYLHAGWIRRLREPAPSHAAAVSHRPIMLQSPPYQFHGATSPRFRLPPLLAPPRLALQSAAAGVAAALAREAVSFDTAT